MNQNTFYSMVKSNKKHMVVFTAFYCSPCKQYKKNIELILSLHPEFDIHIVDVDDAIELSNELGFSSVPATVFISDGTYYLETGLKEKDTIAEFFNLS